MRSWTQRLALLAGCAVVGIALLQVAGRDVSRAAPAVFEGPVTLTYFVGAGDSATGFKPSDPDLARWAFDAWQRSSDNMLRLEPAPAEDEALIRLYWAPADGTFGEMRPIRVGDRLGAALFVHPDLDQLEPTIAERATSDPLLRDTVVFLTCVHEIGHALGAVHTRDERDIMYFFGYGGDIVEFFMRYRRPLQTRANLSSASVLSSADIRQLRDRLPLQ